jgi:nucleotide-binding universal stress UspA family protein
MNILVAVDLSQSTAKVIEAASGIAELTGASIHVLHVVEADADFIGDNAVAEIHQAQVARDFPLEYNSVKTLVEKLNSDGLEASTCLVRGPAIATTLREADRLEVGLIVVGTHGRGAVYDVLIGSYSAGVIRKSKLPVLVVPMRGNGL